MIKINFSAILCLMFLLSFSSEAQTTLKDSKYGTIVEQYLSSTSSKGIAINTKDILVNRENFSEKTEIANVYLNQTYKGIKVFNAISTISIKNNKVFHFANNFKNNIETKIESSQIQLSETDAIEKAASFFKLGNTGKLHQKDNQEGEKLFLAPSISQTAIPVALVYCEKKDGNFVVAYNLNIHTLDGSHWWSVRVNAQTGEIIDYNDRVTHCSFNTDHNQNTNSAIIRTKSYSHNAHSSAGYSISPLDGSTYNVFALPIESPLFGDRSIVTEPASAVASPFGWHDTNGVIGAEFTITRGNNVWAQDDEDANTNTSGFSADGGNDLNFNFPLNFNQESNLNLEAATTNMFYVSNMMHDILYNHGFDEASGNFQENNYGNGGIGGDYVSAQVQDGSGINNARFTTGADGSIPRLEMFLFTPQIDGVAGNALTINNGALAGQYIGYAAAFGEFPEMPITEDLVLLIDDDSTPQPISFPRDPNDGCDPILNTAELNGKIAVIKREGLCFDDDKISNAQDAGAIAVIVVAEDNNPEVMTVSSTLGTLITIPSIMVDNTIGTAIIDALNNNETINATIVDAGPYEIDSAFDNKVIAHEYAHGLSFRLTGGADRIDCLTSTFQMGEGWSDWFGLMVTMKPTDNETDAKTIGTYSLGQPDDGLGFRNVRYSTDFSINSFTYATTNSDNATSVSDDDSVNNAVHFIGSIWCTMLWDLTWAYVNKYGFDPDLFNGNGGNNKVMRLVIEGMKIQPCDPEFIEGRDAILAADMALTGGEDQCLIWDAFARRGLGVNATKGDVNDPKDQVEDFEVPLSSDPSLTNCSGATLSSTSVGSKIYSVFPNPTSNVLNIQTKQLISKATLRVIDINGRTVINKIVKDFDYLNLDVSALKSGLYFLNINSDTITINEKFIINKL